MTTCLVKNILFIVLGFLFSMPVSVKPAAKPAGEIVYSCNLSPAEVMSAEVTKTLKDDPDAEICFEFHTTAVKEGQTLVKSLEGLPGDQPQDDDSVTITIMVPVLVSDFRDNDVFDAEAFQSYVSETLSRLQARESVEGFTCGNSPSDTVIVELIDSCLLGSLKSDFVGRVHLVSGDKEWIVRSSKFSFSDRVECKSQIQ